MVQLEEILDISIPREKGIEELPVEAQTDGDVKEVKSNKSAAFNSGGANRTLKLLVSDGCQSIAAFELSRCDQLSPSTPPGTKV